MDLLLSNSAQNTSIKLTPAQERQHAVVVRSCINGANLYIYNIIYICASEDAKSANV
jgi:hypothetical protein